MMAFFSKNMCLHIQCRFAVNLFYTAMSVGITLQHLYKAYDNVRAVDDISLAIEAGELFFLLGPSGCGKTTLLRCIAGFNEPDAGRVLIGDRDVTNSPPHVRDTGMVFQSYALWPHLTVAENVAFGLEMRKTPKAEAVRRVHEALALVQMTDRANYKPNQLSGGQQQRVALARALVVKPTCLLLDEPLSNLDAKLRLEMRSEIRRLCKEAGLTAVYVTHDQSEALSIADRIAVLNQGKIQQLGTPHEIYRQPGSRFVAEFIGESNFIPGYVAAIDGDKITLSTPIGTISGTPSRALPCVSGQSLTLSIRPEVVRFNDFPPGQHNVFSGEVCDTLYLGEMAQHRIRVKALDANQDGVEFKAFELNPRINARDKAQSIRFWFDPADVVVLAS